MSPKQFSRRNSPVDAGRESTFEAIRQRLPSNINWEKLTTEKQKNCERAFTAASRRSDRDIDARYQSALTASDMHYLRAGKFLKVSRSMVENEEMYEEEDCHPRRWTSHLRNDADPRMAALNHQYENIDLQFQAAFPGFKKRGMMAGYASSHMSTLAPTSVPVAAPAPVDSFYTAASDQTPPQFEPAAIYGGPHSQQTLDFGMQNYDYAPALSDSSSRPPSIMTSTSTDSSVTGSPMAQMGTPVQSQSPMDMDMDMNLLGGYTMPVTMSCVDPSNVAYAPQGFMDDGFFQGDMTLFDGMGATATDATMWGPGAGMRDEFSEFVNYQ